MLDLPLPEMLTLVPSFLLRGPRALSPAEIGYLRRRFRLADRYMRVLAGHLAMESAAETADHAGLSVATVRSYLHAVRCRLGVDGKGRRALVERIEAALAEMPSAASHESPRTST